MLPILYSDLHYKMGKLVTTAWTHLVSMENMRLLQCNDYGLGEQNIYFKAVF